MRIWPATQSISFYVMKSSGGPRDKPSRISFVFFFDLYTYCSSWYGGQDSSIVRKASVGRVYAYSCVWITSGFAVY